MGLWRYVSRFLPSWRSSDGRSFPWMWCAVAAVAWCFTSGVLLKAQYGNTKPSGLAVITWTESGYTAINLWADDYGYGSGGGVVIYDDGTGLQIAYSQDCTPQVFKAAVISQGAVKVESYGTWNSTHEALWSAIVADFVTYDSLPNGSATAAADCPFAVTPHQDGVGGPLIWTVATGPGFGQFYIATAANPGRCSFAAMKGFFEHCQNGQVANTIGGTFAETQYLAIGAASDLDACCDYGGGGGGEGCGSAQYQWFGGV